MVDNNSGEQTVYQYYTIVGENDTFIGESGDADYAFINNIEEDDEEKGQVMYLSLEPEESYSHSPDVVLNSTVQDDDNDDEEDESSPKIEFVLEDGQMYMRDNNTLKDVDENYTYDPEFISVSTNAEDFNDAEDNNVEEENESRDDIEIKPNVILGLDAEDDEDGNETNFMKVQLEDGTCAYINNTLWNSLVENNKQEEKPKTTVPKKGIIKKFPCTYCDKVYSTAHHLTVHMRNHTGSRPYECPIECCDRAFSTGYSLKAHLRTHTGEAPYGCRMCPKHFKTSGDLLKHVRTHTGEKPFKCPIEGCGRSFTTSNIRKVHVRSHTGERPYACTYPDCKKAFASATNFKNHMRIHSGEKPYKCPVPGCGKCFTEYSSLFKHNVVHKPFKPLKCEYCDQSCKHESTLRAHKQAVHKILVNDDGTEVRLKKEDGNYVFCSSE